MNSALQALGRRDNGVGFKGSNPPTGKYFFINWVGYLPPGGDSQEHNYIRVSRCPAKGDNALIKYDEVILDAWMDKAPVVFYKSDNEYHDWNTIVDPIPVQGNEYLINEGSSTFSVE